MGMILHQLRKYRFAIYRSENNEIVANVSRLNKCLEDFEETLSPGLLQTLVTALKIATPLGLGSGSGSSIFLHTN